MAILSKGICQVIASAQSGTGLGTAVGVPVYPNSSTNITYTITGNATGMVVAIEGTIDGVNWFAIATSTVCPDMQVIVDVPLIQIRSNCTAITGGAFTVTVMVGA